MDFEVEGILSVDLEPSEEKKTRPARKKMVRRNRRKKKRDRRKSVRDGVFVSLSVDNDRRVIKDRRKKVFKKI